MKKIFVFLLGIICLSACTNSGPRTSTTMNIHDESGTIRIKASGKVRFNADRTAISTMSPYGYLEYSHNKKKMRADADGDGNVRYTLRNGYEKLEMDKEGQEFLAHVIRDVVRRGFKN